MTADLFSLAQARQLRDEGMGRAIVSSFTKNWLENARDVALWMAKEYGFVSCDDVLKAFPRPANVSPNATGSLFKDKRFKLVGYKTSTKTSAHSRRIGVYQLNDA